MSKKESKNSWVPKLKEKHLVSIAEKLLDLRVTRPNISRKTPMAKALKESLSSPQV